MQRFNIIRNGFYHFESEKNTLNVKIVNTV